jgi:hypothetical protein
VPRALLPLLAASALLLVLASCAGQPGAGPPSEPLSGQPSGLPAEPAAAAAPVVAVLQARLALARASGFYLILEPAALELRLYYGGALLQAWPVRQIATGRPRVAFAHLTDDVVWHSVTWTGGVLTPARPVDEREIEPPDSEDTTEEIPAVVPPTAEEAIPVPARFRIVFREGLALEVRRAGGDDGWWARQRAAITTRAQDVRAVLWASSRDRVRVRVTLDAAEADALYRALPPDTSLLILPPANQG